MESRLRQPPKRGIVRQTGSVESQAAKKWKNSKNYCCFRFFSIVVVVVVD
jgi:hypothetical protein